MKEEEINCDRQNMNGISWPDYVKHRQKSGQKHWFETMLARFLRQEHEQDDGQQESSPRIAPYSSRRRTPNLSAQPPAQRNDYTPAGGEYQPCGKEEDSNERGHQ